MNTRRNRLSLIILLCAALCLCVTPVFATEFSYWTGSSGNYSAANDTYTIRMYNQSGPYTFTAPEANYLFDVLVVGGGGAGGGGTGAMGGGGAGGVTYMQSYANMTSQIQVYVGSGGTGGTSYGGNGTNSSFGSLVAKGGGGGASNSVKDGMNGGSGGGAVGTNTAGTGISGQGKSGGVGTNNNNAGGGGGNSTQGSNGSGLGAAQPATGGNGGSGYISYINGTVGVCYAGGGGGGVYSASGTGGTGTCGGASAPSGGSDISGNPGTNGLGGGGSGGLGAGGLITGGDGGCGTVIILYRTAGDATITADFTASNTSGPAPLFVNFTDTSTTVRATIDSWYWDFGDGGTSSLQSPDHTYISSGTYVANLTIVNTSYSLVSTKLETITVASSVIVANFSANVTSGYPNDYFQFTDLTSDGPLTWDWTFGDGGTSILQNPVHQYITVGSYDVSLNVTNASSFDKVTKPGYITISPLPVPTAPTFVANKTYTTNTTLSVLFTITSVAPPRMTSYNMSFGDGTWSNTSSSTLGTIGHTYLTVGTFSPTLYVYNAAGGAHTTNTEMIAVSDPFVYLVNNPTTINYGIPSNVTVQLNNITHVNTVLLNITYNKTGLDVKNVYAINGWSQQNTLGPGFVKINLTNPDATYNTNTSVAYIQFNVTTSDGLNASEPLTFIPSNGVIPTASYTNGVYGFNKTYDGSITPTVTPITQTFNIYRTDTGELLSTVQVTNDYTGIVNGTVYTTSGTFGITSIWGTVNITSSASAFYANSLYGVELNGGTTNIYMTPYVPDNTVKLNQLYPKEVRFVALNVVDGAVIPGIGVNAISYNATYDGTNWEAKLYGVSSAATSIEGTTMAGTTDAGGAITFPMISSNQYAMSFINMSAGINQSLLLYPLQTEYRVWINTAGATNNTFSQINGTTLTVNEPNSSYVTLGMNYIDTSGLTDSVTFSVVSESNSTVMYTKTFTSGITVGVSSDYTLQNVRGDGFVWKYVAYRSDSSVLSQGAGITMKGPNGVLVDLGLSTGWYQWISMCILFMLASLASQRTKQFWAILIPAFAAIFLWFGWFTGKSTLSGIIILCVVLGAIIYMKSSLREKFGIGGPGTMLLNIIVYLMILQVCVGFINGLQIWSDAGMTNQAVTPFNAYTNIELTTISNLQGAAGLAGTLIATATIFIDMALTALSMFGAILFSLVTIYPTVQTLFPWMLTSPQTIALFLMLQTGIYVLYVFFIYQTWYKPTIGTADF